MLFRFILRALGSRRTRQPLDRRFPVQIASTEERKALRESATGPVAGVQRPAAFPRSTPVLVETLPRAEVRHIIDGDTVIVDKEWERMTIRLACIDCPEDGQHWGDTAKYGLIKLIGGRKVYLEEYGPDPHGRMLATIYVRHANGEEWVNVNERMVTLGHAWVMRMFYEHLPEDRRRSLNRLESWARSKKVGLWRTVEPMPPWRWRIEARSKDQ
jgi:endonuclease YncB( thermonuclease family)